MRTLIVVGIIFVLAQFALGYVIFKFRNDGRRAGYSHGNNKLETIWTSARHYCSLAGSNGVADLGRRTLR